MPLPLFPFQETAAEWMAGRERCGLFDEMGVGKTAASIRALDIREATRGMVIAPAIARAVWVAEFRKFGRVDRRIVKGINIHDFVAWQHGRYDTIVTSYEMATKWSKFFKENGSPIDFVITDEGHYLKNPAAARTSAILGPECDGLDGIAMWAEQYFDLTGTPMPTDPADIWPFLRMCRAMPLSRGAFQKRYFSTFVGTYSVRNSPLEHMVPELSQLVFNNCMRRTHEQVGLQLPPILVTDIELDGDTREIDALLREHPGMEDAVLWALEQGGLSFLDAQHISTLRRFIGVAKSLPYAELLLEELNGGLDKAVVFGIHRQALEMVRDHLVRNGIACGLIYGDTTERETEAIIHSFQTDDRMRAVVCNIHKASTAITLSAAAALDMLESWWTPGPNWQAIKRVHRISQTRSVRARFITLANSLDEVVNRIVAQRTADIGKVGFVLDGVTVAV